MTNPEFEKFDTTMRKILTVSKTELQRREKEWKRKKAKKKRAKS
jgi:U3 small nucleolar ribonucleoprotein component